MPPPTRGSPRKGSRDPEDAQIEAERLEMLMEVYREFDIDQNGGVGEAEMFVLGTARRYLTLNPNPYPNRWHAR